MLKGKKALITGGTSGLGKEIAKLYVENGAEVAIMGTNKERAEKVKLEFGISHAIICNVANTKEVKKAVDTLLKEWGTIDILVNCAGITRDSLFMKMSEEAWDQVIDTNLKSVYNLCHALTRPMMRARSGKIINITSVIGLTGNPGQVNYAASKLGVVGASRSLAKELGSRGITVNCIAPGFFVTPMTDKLGDEQKKSVLDSIPLKRFGDPKELASVALFLASPMADYITGQVITVDGGMLA